MAAMRACPHDATFPALLRGDRRHLGSGLSLAVAAGEPVLQRSLPWSREIADQCFPEAAFLPHQTGHRSSREVLAGSTPASIRRLQSNVVEEKLVRPQAPPAVSKASDSKRHRGHRNAGSPRRLIDLVATLYGVAIIPVNVRTNTELKRGVIDIARALNGGLIVTTEGRYWT